MYRIVLAASVIGTTLFLGCEQLLENPETQKVGQSERLANGMTKSKVNIGNYTPAVCEAQNGIHKDVDFGGGCVLDVKASGCHAIPENGGWNGDGTKTCVCDLEIVTPAGQEPAGCENVNWPSTGWSSGWSEALPI